MDQYSKQTTLSNHAVSFSQTTQQCTGSRETSRYQDILMLPQNPSFSSEKRRNLIKQLYKWLRVRKRTPENMKEVLFTALTIAFQTSNSNYRQLHL